MEITGKTKNSPDEENYVIRIYLDLTKAFDTLNHDICYTNVMNIEYVDMPIISQVLFY